MFLQSQMPLFPREGDEYFPTTTDSWLTLPEVANAVERVEDENLLRLLNEGVSAAEFDRQATARLDDYPDLFSWSSPVI